MDSWAPPKGFVGVETYTFTPVEDAPAPDASPAAT